MKLRHAVVLSAALPALLAGTAGPASADGATVYSAAYCDDTYDFGQDVFCESQRIVAKATQAANGNFVVVTNSTYSYSYTDNGVLVAGRDEKKHSAYVLREGGTVQLESIRATWTETGNGAVCDWVYWLTVVDGEPRIDRFGQSGCTPL